MLSSMQENLLFQAFGWEQDLVGRRWLSPKGVELSYDTVMKDFGSSREGELALVLYMQRYGSVNIDAVARLIWDGYLPVGFTLACGCEEDGTSAGKICSQHLAMFGL